MGERNYLSYIFFCKFFWDVNSTNQSAKADLEISSLEGRLVPEADSQEDADLIVLKD